VERLRAQLGYLQRQLQVEFPARLKEARSDGGGDRNDEVLQAMEEEAVVSAAVRRIEDLLDGADVVEVTSGTDSVITLGSIVEIEDSDSALVRSYELVGAFEDVPNGVSMSSPMGKALIGRAVGDEVSIVLPSGGVRELRILSLQ
jgi:transcription elongation factor GreA